jgi:hypothetical protein
MSAQTGLPEESQAAMWRGQLVEILSPLTQGVSGTWWTLLRFVDFKDGNQCSWVSRYETFDEITPLAAELRKVRR